MDINRDPECVRTMDLDMALRGSKGLDITTASRIGPWSYYSRSRVAVADPSCHGGPCVCLWSVMKPEATQMFTGREASKDHNDLSGMGCYLNPG